MAVKKVISDLVPKNNDLIIFGTSSGRFTDNSKYAFLESSELEEKKSVWIADDEETANRLREKGYLSYSSNSWKGKLYCLRARYAIITHNIEDISFLASGSEIVNLWHGFALKDISENEGNDIKSGFKRFYGKIFFSSDRFLLTSKKYRNLFGDQIASGTEIYAGYPRNDIFAQTVEGEELFAEEKISREYVIYMPTYRDEKEFADAVDLKELDKAFSDKNTELELVLKPHPNTKIEQKFDNITVIQNQKDVYPLLKASEALITDYSSVMFDYMHTGNPVIRYVFDKDNYESKRGLNDEAKDLQPGKEVRTVQELEKTVKNLEDLDTDYSDKINEVFGCRKPGLQAQHILDQIE